MNALLSILVFVSASSFAADPAAPSATSQQPPEWLKYTVPGEGHKVLEDTVGTFSFNMKWWESPTSEPQVSKGTSKTTWIMNKRFVQEDVSVPKTKNSPAFKGRGIMGYDNFPLTTLEEKKALTPRMYEEKWMLFFEHDPESSFTKLEATSKWFKASPIENYEL